MSISRQAIIRRGSALAASMALSSLTGLLALAQNAASADGIPVPAIEGPLPNAPFDDPENDYQFFRSDIALGSHGYVEEEFYVEGEANAYDIPYPRDEPREPPIELPERLAEIERAAIPYKTRMIVRRPVDEADFNGTVVVEWLNVTDGFDGEYFWVQAQKALLRDGYAYVGISAQDNSISVDDKSLKQFSPQRYGTLDVTGGGEFDRSELSFDIYAQAAKAAWEVPEILDGMKPTSIIGVGMSQSGIFNGSYLNYLHMKQPIYDGVLLQVWNAPIRDDIDIPVIKVLSETEADYMPISMTQPDTDMRKTYWVAGSSHGDIVQRNGRNGVRLRDLGVLQTGDDGCGPEGPTGEAMTRPRTPFAHVVNAALHHLKQQVETGVQPPTAPRIEAADEGSGDIIARDGDGNAKGGIRLAAMEVPTARADGVVCGAIGVWEPFGEDKLQDLYPSHDAYVSAVRAAVDASVEAGFVLPRDAAEQIALAEASLIGTGLTCGALCLDRGHYRLDYSSTGVLRGVTEYYNIVDGDELMDAIDAAHRYVAQGDTADGNAARQFHALAGNSLRDYLRLLEAAEEEGRVTATASDILSMQAHTILAGLQKM
ncbi:alpha/beta hydrolase domain-containing protein [Palleronia sp. LCG004]|uniref:alpha/beta hydrolase domain-containing protein n=1 Tax=Palleronia sp. LCG004 TaxID=3079304 RepID=UPI002943CB10|nr:alpha/beta hydrolase domain-containing protein [Palleronia sp. LCG004]WOI58270.1 alpha/beta hydrolase domain-containing protein [Palleronia sp. LCG004]